MSRLTQFLNEQLWLVTEERHAVIRGVIEGIDKGTIVHRVADDQERKLAVEEQPHTITALANGNAEKAVYAAERGGRGGTRGAGGEDKATLIVPFSGTIYPRLGPMAPESGGGVNLQQTMAVMRRAVNDPGIASIIGDFDSPGGMVAGVPEAAEEIRALRGIKPMTAVASYQMASAAYYLGSQFDEVVASPSSSLGSIGVVAQYVSAAKAIENEGLQVQILKYPDLKAEADGINPLSDEAFAFRMEQIKKTYCEFEKNVALGLRIDRTVVAETFGRGRSLDAETAVRVGAAHRMATLDTVIVEHLSGRVERMPAFRRSVGRVGMLDEVQPLTDESRVHLDRVGERLEEQRRAEAAAQRAAHAKRWGFGAN